MPLKRRMLAANAIATLDSSATTGHRRDNRETVLFVSDVMRP